MSTITKPIILDSTGQAIAEGIKAIANSKAVSNFNHNSVCRDGVELTDKYSIAQILSKVQSGDFEDIYVGDTITVNITTSLGGTEQVELLVAGINSFGADMVIWNSENDEYNGAKRNHLALITKDCLKTAARMNATNTAENGYYSSEMATTTLPIYLNAFEEVFGMDRIFAPYNSICSDTDFTKDSIGSVRYYENDYTWYSEDDWTDGDNKFKMQLMTEREVYGQNIFDHSYDGCNYGGLRKQLPIFRLRPDYIQCGRGYKGATSSRQWYWLQDVAGSSGCSRVSVDGNCDNYVASFSGGVRPLLYIG